MSGLTCGCERGGDCTTMSVCAAESLIEEKDERIEELQAEVKLVKRNYDVDVGFWQQLCADLDPKTAALFLDSPKVSDLIAELEAENSCLLRTLLGGKDDE